ncbi:MAG: ParB N-terminal domain-containing protein [Flavobacteriales bacterium]|nr:ParB N-terminal domain-containing protein [Flavobacteriales bacterium]MBK7940938.1 ParB N-terminal domain-containing protein [Flavobacteriales bacterium]MBK8948414.1 ParB N-terminal domain-containing protein [Flavobacteriales bacterium]MBK9701639.1 ParB N-terminal domain-containing protein [Flavobacteriales bacterium]
MSTPATKKPEWQPLDKLLFDPENPRLPTSKTNASDDEVYRYMLEEGKVTDLMQSIGQQGYFSGEPLMVVPSSKTPGKFEVVEGNRRLAALKLLVNPEYAPIKQASVDTIALEAQFKPTEVPVIIYDRRSDVLQYLGYRHITGVDQWDSLAKARYLHQLLGLHSDKSYADQLRNLSRTIGSRADYVHKLLTGFALYKDIEGASFFGIPGISEESFSFSVLTTALSYKGISEHIGLGTGLNRFDAASVNRKHLKELTEWLFKETAEGRTRLGESRKLRTLNAVVLSKRALAEFRKGRSLDEASLLTDEPNQVFTAAIDHALRRLKDARDQSHLIDTPAARDIEALLEVARMAKDLHDAMKVKRNSPSDLDDL